MQSIDQDYVKQATHAIKGNMETTPENQEFRNFVEHIVKDYWSPGLGEHSLRESIFCFINNTLHKFHLNHTYDIYDIFHEVYTRGDKTTKRGEKIENPKAWIKKTSYNVVRELSRKNKVKSNNEISYDVVLEASLSLADSCSTASENSYEEVEEFLRSIIPDADALDITILILSIIDNVEMNEIRNHLRESENLDITCDALRKRKQRFLQSLKKILNASKSDRQQYLTWPYRCIPK